MSDRIEEVMETLKENEWNTINKLLLELYELDNLNDFSEKLLKMFRMLIPYTQGYFMMFDEDQRINLKNSSNVGMKDEVWNTYVNQFFEKDYINYILDFADSTMTYKDTELFDDNIRKNTEFYQNFLKPYSIPYGCGIILIKDKELLGVINLFRSVNLGDFTEKDMRILEVLKMHLSNIVYRLVKGSKDTEQVNQERITHLTQELGLSTRETEVMQYMLKGYSNADISDALIISLSTVKKHIYNIFTKAGVKSRTQLAAMFSL